MLATNHTFRMRRLPRALCCLLLPASLALLGCGPLDNGDASDDNERAATANNGQIGVNFPRPAAVSDAEEVRFDATVTFYRAKIDGDLNGVSAKFKATDNATGESYYTPVHAISSATRQCWADGSNSWCSWNLWDRNMALPAGSYTLRLLVKGVPGLCTPGYWCYAGSHSNYQVSAASNGGQLASFQLCQSVANLYTDAPPACQNEIASGSKLPQDDKTYLALARYTGVTGTPNVSIVTNGPGGQISNSVHYRCVNGLGSQRVCYVWQSLWNLACGSTFTTTVSGPDGSQSKRVTTGSCFKSYCACPLKSVGGEQRAFEQNYSYDGCADTMDYAKNLEGTACYYCSSFSQGGSNWKKSLYPSKCGL